MLLAEQLVDQRLVHPGPLVVHNTFDRIDHPLFQGAQTISSPVYMDSSEGDGILQIGAVIFDEMIPQPTRPRVFQRKSLRGQTQSM